ncbi:MAG: hypothetical protein WC686_01415 [Candidatus Shapirobacteria bacterium]
MLPKPEKNKKSLSSKQLDLVDSISHADKVRHKRHIILIILLLSVGLSTGFWIYRWFQSSASRRPFFSFALPRIKTSPLFGGSSLLEKNITTFLADDSNYWSIHVLWPLNSPNNVVYSRNFENLFSSVSLADLTSQLLAQAPSLNSSLLASLPQGLPVKESITSVSGSYYQHAAIISLPEEQLFIAVKVSGTDGLPKSIAKLPELFTLIYWSLVPQN